MHQADKEMLRLEKFDRYWRDELNLVFNDIAARYDTANDFFSFGIWRRIRRRFVGMISITDNNKVLDVCAGTNAVGIDLLSINPQIEVTAVDRSAAMQQVGAARAMEKGYSIKSVIADVHRLPFTAQYFDIVTLEAATRHLKVTKVFHEIHRVLKTGGYFYHCDLVKPENARIAFIYRVYLRVMIPLTTLLFFRTNEFLGVRERALKLAGYFIETINAFYTAEELSAILRETGFKDIETITLAGGTVAIHRARK